MKKSIVGVILLGLMSFGCDSQEIPAAHKGRMFDKTGAWALWSGGVGFTGPVLGPGTHYTGLYPELRIVECGQLTHKETLESLTKDGVQFKLDVYVSYGSNCDEENAVVAILEKFSPGWPNDDKHPEWKNIVFGIQLYDQLARPALGEAVRESVSPYIANDVNSKREAIFATIRTKFDQMVSKQSPKMLNVYAMNLSNLDFPEAMDKANTERAVQSILKDKAIAERERVTAEIETSTMRKKLAEADANNEVARIDAVGQAYSRNPGFLQLQIAAELASKGNLIITDGKTPIMIQNK